MSIAAVLALAIGIAGNSAMFSIVSAVLVKPLPYPNPERIIAVFNQVRGKPDFIGAVSLQDFRDWQKQSKTLDSWALYLPLEGSVVIDGTPITVRETYITNGLVQDHRDPADFGNPRSAGCARESRAYLHLRAFLAIQPARRPSALSANL